MYASNNRKEKCSSSQQKKRFVDHQPSSSNCGKERDEIVKSFKILSNGEGRKNDKNNNANDDGDCIQFVSSTKNYGKTSRVYDQDTKLSNFMFPSKYQEQTFKFLYDFFTKDSNADSPYVSERGMFDILAGLDVSLPDYVQCDNAQTLIIDQTLGTPELINSLRSFPTVRVIHESISTSPLILSECSMQFCILVLEVKIALLYRQYMINRCIDNLSEN